MPHVVRLVKSDRTDRVCETECEVQHIGMRLFAFLVGTSSTFGLGLRRIPDTCSLASGIGVIYCWRVQICSFVHSFLQFILHIVKTI